MVLLNWVWTLSGRAVVWMRSALIANPVWAGVVFEVETTYHSGSGRGPEGVEMSVEERARLEIQENAVNMAREHPEDVAQLIRTWLMEE